MQRFVFFQLALLTLLFGADSRADQPGSPRQSSTGQPASATRAEKSESGDLIAQGEYLVHHVAMCVQCHSPHNADGSLDENQLLAGAPMPVKSPFQGRQWAFRAPSLRGLPGGWNEDQLVNFLQTGQPPTDYEIRPPMPPFRLKEEDARAVAGYLKSLAGK